MRLVVVVVVVVVMALPSCLQWTTSASLHPKRQEWSVVGAVESVLTSHAPCQHACLLLANQHEELEVTQAPRGVRVLRAVGGSVNGSDASHGRLRETVDGVREVLQDVPRWSTRILVLTRLPLSHLGGLHGLLSNRNAMLLRIQDHKTSRRVGVFVWQPYSAPDSTPLRVATWTPHGRLTLASHMSLFPDKFSVFSSAPRLKVVVELLPAHSLSWVDDAGEPGGRRLEYTGYISDVVKYFATRMNFTTTYVLSPERTFGSRMPDGSWTGMIGMVVREVWAVTLAALLGVLLVLLQFPSCLPGKPLLRGSWSANTFSPVRILLQQGEASETVLGPYCRMLLNILKVSVLSGSSCHPLMKTNSALLTPNADVEWPAEWWWWERLVLGLWMLTDATFGEMREVAGLEKEGRLEFHTQARYKESLDTLVRAGGHVLVDAGNSLKKLVASDFSNKGSVCVAGRGSECRPGGVVHGAHVPPLGRFTHSPPPTVSQEGVCVTCVVLQGVFVLLGGGVVAGLAVWCLEVLVKPWKEH
ncbi:hypothetical protein O3P69_014443 [Scylla paramamosain]|uniref:Ionotropic glutamate receptor L-glutamate and glycine-binding domain-containing protein n=1 Tax=Scylla paramamosain TaxID=85552 RepID=A0AAW0TE00_SCYPA